MKNKFIVSGALILSFFAGSLIVFAAPAVPTVKTTVVAPIVKKAVKIIDCGTVNAANPDSVYNNKVNGCFNPKFKKCEPAKISIMLGAKTTYSYEIISPKDNLCQVKLSFLKNSNKNLIGKDMTCLYNNSTNFGSGISYSSSKCTGPLNDLINQDINTSKKLAPIVDLSILPEAKLAFPQGFPFPKSTDITFLKINSATVSPIPVPGRVEIRYTTQEDTSKILADYSSILKSKGLTVGKIKTSTSGQKEMAAYDSKNILKVDITVLDIPNVPKTVYLVAPK